MGVLIWIWRVIKWCIENWKLLTMFFLVIFVLSLTGNITMTIKSVKRGFKEAWGPIGIAVLIVIVTLVIWLYTSFSKI